MALKTFKNKGETNSIPINANNLNYNFTEILNLVYPLGRGFIDFTDTDYSNYLGFTWERELIGMTPIGIDVNDNDFNQIGKVGGEKSHILTINEMPSHAHVGQFYSHNFDHSVTIPSSKVYVNSIDYEVIGFTQNSLSNSEIVQTADTLKIGGSQSHNNLQPYKIVSYWKRIA